MEETHRHVLDCQYQKAKEKCIELLSTLEEELSKVHTHPDLITIICREAHEKNVLVMDVTGHQK